MKILSAIVLVAFSAVSTVSVAQNVYKCPGAVYRQTPCADGSTMTMESQTRAQVATARANTRRDSNAADSMEKARLKQESRAPAAYIPQPKAESKPVAADTAPRKNSPRKAKKKEPEYFTAVVPGSGKQARKKKTAKQTLELL
jgi:Fe-S oxidoreductase